MTNLRRIEFLFELVFCTVVHVAVATTPPLAKLTIKALNDEGQVLPQARVHVWLSEEAVRSGQTDTNGLFVAEGPCTVKDIPISVVKQGYYDSRLTYSYPNYLSIKENMWQPWNPIVTVVTRRIVRPIPMFVKRVMTPVPIENAPFAFDVQAGDWVEPYGRGRVPDMIFHVTRRLTNADDYEGTLRVTFPNAFDGIQQTRSVFIESAFRFPRFAAEDGYETNYVYVHGKHPTTGYYGARVDDPQKYYLIRVRSIGEGNGTPKQALYGILAGDIELTGIASSNNARIAFTYYLNPTPNDRNLEFDPKRNLFTDLEARERVTEP